MKRDEMINITVKKKRPNKNQKKPKEDTTEDPTKPDIPSPHKPE